MDDEVLYTIGIVILGLTPIAVAVVAIFMW